MAQQPSDLPQLFNEPHPPPRALTVTELTQLIKQALQRYLPTEVAVRGELSNVRRPPSGHLYMTLKDAENQIQAVMWRSDVLKLRFQPVDGLAVIATGHVDMYGPQGRLQLYVQRLEPAGIGELELAFRQLAERLRAEGLFDPAHKKPIPRYPLRIAVITSPTGAAIRDIVRTIHRRWPVATILLYPVRVQGDGSAAEIAHAIESINRNRLTVGGVDVMIVGRGGGSMEDLWAFNEEIVARAIYASRIPVISAVGHEIDTTIADLVADLRAATPTAAGELAVPVLAEVTAQLYESAARLSRALRNRLQLAAERLNTLASAPAMRRPTTLLNEPRQRLDQLRTQLVSALQQLGAVRRQQLSEAVLRLRSHWPGHRLKQQQMRLESLGREIFKATRALLNEKRSRLSAAGGRLAAVDPKSVLRRGYTITRSVQPKRIITNPDQVRPGQLISTEFADGRGLRSRVTGENQLDLFESQE